MDNFTLSDFEDSEAGIEMCPEESGIPSSDKIPAEPHDSDNEADIRNDGSALVKIETLYGQLSERISEMETLFTKRIMHTDYEDKVIDQLHSELQRYKEDLYAQLLRPVLLDVIEVRDSIMKNAAVYLAKPEGEQSIPNDTFSMYAHDLQDILEKNNVEIYSSKNGDLFVPVKQRVIKKEITDDESLHGKIAESLSNGYNYGGRVISAEKVSVYCYQKNEKSESESEDN